MLFNRITYIIFQFGFSSFFCDRFFNSGNKCLITTIVSTKFQGLLYIFMCIPYTNEIDDVLKMMVKK